MTAMARTPTEPTLTSWRTGAADLAYTDSGAAGAPVLLIHAGGLADWFTPLAATPALRAFRVIRLVRAGYTGTRPPDGLTVADHAAHAATLLRHLGAAPAHVVAHSSGSVIALQLAVDHPELVRTLCLGEPPLVDALAAPADRESLRAALGPAIGSAMAAVARADFPAAFDTFMTAVCGPDYRRVMVSALGAGRVDEGAKGCGYFFTDEMPAVNAWDPGPVATVRTPVLLIQGAASPPPVHHLVTRLAGQLPNATIATIRDVNHLLPLTAPAEMARLVADFSQSH